LLRAEGLYYLPILSEFRQLMSIEQFDKDLVSTCRSKLNRAAKSLALNAVDPRFLISWEGFSGSNKRGYQNARAVAECVREITQDYDVYILVYLRRQDDFMESLYTQWIQQGESYKFQQFVNKFTGCDFNWKELLESYSQFFGKGRIIVRRYTKAYLPEADSLLKDFAKIVGIQSNIIDTIVETPNRGYSRDAVQLARLVDPYLSDQEKKVFRRILQQTNSKQPFDDYSYWNREERSKFLAQYSQSNAIVAREYFNDPSGVLFPLPDDYEDHKKDEGLSLEKATVALAKAAIHTAIMVEQKVTGMVLMRAVLNIERKTIRLLSRFPRLKSRLQKLIKTS